MTVCYSPSPQIIRLRYHLLSVCFSPRGGGRKPSLDIHADVRIRSNSMTSSLFFNSTGHLFASMTTPFVDMTVKGFLWYQGENNMGGVKGNSAASLGYACNQKALVVSLIYIYIYIYIYSGV